MNFFSIAFIFLLIASPFHNFVQAEETEILDGDNANVPVVSGSCITCQKKTVDRLGVITKQLEKGLRIDEKKAAADPQALLAKAKNDEAIGDAKSTNDRTEGANRDKVTTVREDVAPYNNNSAVLQGAMLDTFAHDMMTDKSIGAVIAEAAEGIALDRNDAGTATVGILAAIRYNCKHGCVSDKDAESLSEIAPGCHADNDPEDGVAGSWLNPDVLKKNQCIKLSKDSKAVKCMAGHFMMMQAGLDDLPRGDKSKSVDGLSGTLKGFVNKARLSGTMRCKINSLKSNFCLPQSAVSDPAPYKDSNEQAEINGVKCGKKSEAKGYLPSIACDRLKKIGIVAGQAQKAAGNPNVNGAKLNELTNQSMGTVSTIKGQGTQTEGANDCGSAGQDKALDRIAELIDSGEFSRFLASKEYPEVSKRVDVAINEYDIKFEHNLMVALNQVWQQTDVPVMIAGLPLSQWNIMVAEDKRRERYKHLASIVEGSAASAVKRRSCEVGERLNLQPLVAAITAPVAIPISAAIYH